MGVGPQGSRASWSHSSRWMLSRIKAKGKLRQSGTSGLLTLTGPGAPRTVSRGLEGPQQDPSPYLGTRAKSSTREEVTQAMHSVRWGPDPEKDRGYKAED